jgi:hypothetical protein
MPAGFPTPGRITNHPSSPPRRLIPTPPPQRRRDPASIGPYRHERSSTYPYAVIAAD